MSLSSSERFYADDVPIDYTKADPNRVKAEPVEDGGSVLHSSGDMVLSEQLPFVCQTVEVRTENEDQTVSSSHSYPLQISPVSSYGSDTESDIEDRTDSVGVLWRAEYPSSVLRVPPCSLPSMSTFVTASKPNFRVTSTRDPAPLISYHADGWTPAFTPSDPGTPSAPGHHEKRASVIMKTSDVTSS